MIGRPKYLILAASLALAPALLLAQDRAVPRGGGGGGSSGGGGGHPSPGVTSSGNGSSSSGSSGSSSGSGSTYSPSTAERRHPHAGSGSGHGGYYPYHPYYPYYPYYGWGGYYPGYGYSYWWPYGAFGWYGGYWGYPGGWGGGTVYHSDEQEGGSLRVLVDPPEARVYVDGYYAGTVDDFDGLFQRLHVSPGRHEIVLKLEGYKTHRVNVSVSPDATLKIEYDMEKGQGETVEDMGKNAPGNEPPRLREQDPRWTEPEQRPQMRMEETGAPSGRLELSVRPDDASVYVDGAFRGSAREASSLKLPAGRHRVEIVRPGFRTHEQQVDVAPGETTNITVELEKPVV